MPTDENTVFGKEFLIDILFVDGEVIFHGVDITTKLPATTFLNFYRFNFGNFRRRHCVRVFVEQGLSIYRLP